MRNRSHPLPMLARLPLGMAVAVGLAIASASCVTVRPQQRGVLADPIMRFGGSTSDQNEQALTKHALDNREGSFGGDGVTGGGCGCN